MRHTPGPWRIGKTIKGAPTIESCDTEKHFVIAFTPFPSLENYANACLMSAAPELLGALEDAQQALAHALYRLKDDSSFSTGIALRGAEEKARLAIAKAKGEQ